jgi:D-alanyl-D-alanine carboxypeptidase/D-alanyl-D-alanine-endopeptidase (penicillin-binding protein 4)
MALRAVIFVFCALSCSATDLEHRIDTIADATGPATRGFVGIHVVELATGKTLYHRNEDRLFMPASNMKLLTSALAMLRLGADYRFTTKLMMEPSGNLVFIGSGDPSMSGRGFPYNKDASNRGPGLQAIEELANQVVKSGVNRIDGDVIGNDSLYPWAPYAPSWTQDDVLNEFGAPVSALTLNENVVTLLIHAGARAGDAAELSLNPSLEYFTFDNRLVTVEAKITPRVRISRAAGSRQILVWGSVPAGHATIAETMALDDPALYAATALYEALTRRGVVITGHAVARHRAAFDDDAPLPGTVVASRVSPPMVQLLQVMDKVSQNLFAELMLREVGRVTRHSGTREAGLEELDTVLSETGAGKDDARTEDGSGLARNAMVTPRLLTRVLVHMHSIAKFRDDWLSLLPVGGEDGTLRHRFAGAAGTPALIRAKTGSLSRALSLAGYAESKTHGRLAFSIMVNDFAAPQNEVRAWIDKIAMTLLD